MKRRDAIKSLGILTAGIVSGASLVADTLMEPTDNVLTEKVWREFLTQLPRYPNVESIRFSGGIMDYIQHVGIRHAGPLPDEFKGMLGDWV